MSKLCFRKVKRFGVSLLLVSVFILSSAALAEEAPKADSTKAPVYLLKETVVTANRYEQDAFKLPQSVSIISREEIEKENPQIVADLLRVLPGVEVNDAGPFRTRPIIRGMYGSRVLILVDGERLNDTRESTFSGAQLSLIDISQVERIEVIHGPGSILYGSDALGGVINIITKNPNHSQNGNFSLSGDLNLKYSTIDEQRKARLELNGGNDRWTFLFGGNIRKANDYKSPSGTVVNSAIDKDDNLDFKGEYNLDKKQTLSLEGQRFRAEGIGYPGTPNEFTPKFSFPYHNRDKFALRYEARNLTPHLLSLKSKIYYQKISKDFDSDLLTPAGPGMNLNSFSRTLTDVKFFGASFQELFLTGKDQHLTWGMDYYREMIEGSRYLRTTITDTTSSVLYDKIDTYSTVPENNLDVFGVYVNNEYSPLDKANLSMGLRYDYFNTKIKETSDYVDYRQNPSTPFPSKTQSTSSLNGGIGLVYKLTDHLNLTANVASAFRVPNVVEKYFFGRASGSEFVIPNYDLSPEKSVNLDLGVKANFSKIYASLTYFLNNYKDFIDLESTGDSIDAGSENLPVWHYANVSDARIQGLEGEIETQIDPLGLYTFANLTYTRGDNLSSDQPIYVAPFKSYFGLGWKEKNDRLRLEINWRYVEKQDRVPRDSQGRYLDEVPTKGFDILNLEASINLLKWQSLNVSLNNLTNKLYSEPYNAANPYNQVYEPGRNLIISLTTRF
jgi:hemoglobin/transferrin/lactoferrin receptor protein